MNVHPHVAQNTSGRRSAIARLESPHAGTGRRLSSRRINAFATRDSRWRNVTSSTCSLVCHSRGHNQRSGTRGGQLMMPCPGHEPGTD
jgi:hypothetical protein